MVATLAATRRRGAAKAQATTVRSARKATAIAKIRAAASWQAKRRGAGLGGTLGHGFITPKHPFDYLYDVALRPLLGAREEFGLASSAAVLSATRPAL